VPTARLLTVCAAVIVCAWFALGIRQAHDISRATTVVGGLNGQTRLTAAQAREANSLLNSAATLNPDRTVEVLQARVALLRGDRAQAKRILLGVLASEPDNLDAWYGLATSASDSATINHALARIAQLEPKPRR
jgi:predicted Zn-dependent protease